MALAVIVVEVVGHCCIAYIEDSRSPLQRWFTQHSDNAVASKQLFHHAFWMCIKERGEVIWQCPVFDVVSGPPLAISHFHFYIIITSPPKEKFHMLKSYTILFCVKLRRLLQPVWGEMEMCECLAD